MAWENVPMGVVNDHSLLRAISYKSYGGRTKTTRLIVIERMMMT